MPFFSPDGQWIAFAVDSKLKKVAGQRRGADRHRRRGSGDTPLLMQGHWGADGTIVIAQRERGLMSVSAEGGVLRPLTTPESAKGVIDHHHAPFQLSWRRASLYDPPRRRSSSALRYAHQRAKNAC